MNKTIITAALVAASSLLFTKPAIALTFLFNWTSNAVGLSPQVDNQLHTAIGSLDIDLTDPLANITAANVSNIDIIVSDNMNRSFRLTSSNLSIIDFDGVISQDGTSVNVNFLRLQSESLNSFFRCRFVNCAVSRFSEQDLQIEYNGERANIDANTQDNLRNSFEVTVIPFETNKVCMYVCI